MRMNNLYKWAVFVGLDVHTVSGWSTRGSSSFAPTISLSHWIAGPRGVAEGRRPMLNLVTVGRSGLPGPLCNDYMGRSGECVLVAAGRANHAGRGSWKGVTGNTGSMGTEAEAADNRDWTAKQKTTWPLFHIYKLFAMWEKGLISWNQITADRACSHAEFALPRGRKVDINGYEMPAMRRQVDALLPEFKRIVNQKPIAVGTSAVYNPFTGKFTSGKTVAPVTTPSTPPVPSTPSPSTNKPTVGDGKTIWPQQELPLSDSHTKDTHNAWVKLLSDVGYNESTLTLMIQKWLKAVGYYGGAIDNDFGSMTTKDLQRFLKDRGFGSGNHDGVRDNHVIHAEIQYLNSQREFYDITAPSAKSAAELAQEVIAGKHGNGQARKDSLGDRYDEVQAEVDKLMGRNPVAKGEEKPKEAYVFTDVPESHPQYEAIKFLKDSGLSKGYSDGSFRPSREITRAEVAVLLQRLHNLK